MIDAMTETPEEKAYFDARGGVEPAEDPAPVPDPAPQPDPAPTPAPPAPEPVVDPAAPSPPPAGHVPLAALHESRAKEKAEKARADQLQAIIDNLARGAAQPQQQPQAPQPLEKRLEENPVEVLKELAQAYHQTQQQTQEQEAVVGILQHSRGLEHQFAETVGKDAYDGAIEHLHNQLLEEFRIGGVPEPVARQNIARMAATTAAQAMQQGRNPGELFFALAKARGYSGMKQIPAPAGAPAPAPRQPDPAAVVAAVEQGRQQHKSLEGGEGPDAELSLEAAGKLEGAAFDKWWAKNAKRLMH